MKRKAVLILCGVLALTLCACGQKADKKDGGDGNKEISIPVIMTTGANDSMDIRYKNIIEDFNKEYEGKYKIEAEFLAGSADDYRSKLKMLNTSNSMPAMIQVGAEPAFYDLLVKNDRLVDVAPFLEEDQEWKSRVMEQGITDLKEEDGGLYVVPPAGIQLSGIYYNKELFKKAGIESFPKTWDEFWETCEKLKEAEIPALSLHTTETAWSPMLLATSSMGQSEAGKEFMQKQYPDSYNTEEFKKAMEIFVRQFDYTTSDAVGGTYALAANNFFSGNTAMLANGPWMMSSLSDENYAPAGFEEKVGYASFPGNVMIGTMEQQGWCVTVDHGDEVAKGAMEFLKYSAKPEYTTQNAVKLGELSPNVEISDEEYEKMIPAMKDYVDLSKDVVVVENYQMKWDAICQNDIFTREFPNLLTGKLTIDEMIEEMDKGAEQYKSDIQ